MAKLHNICHVTSTNWGLTYPHGVWCKYLILLKSYSRFRKSGHYVCGKVYISGPSLSGVKVVCVCVTYRYINTIMKHDRLEMHICFTCYYKLSIVSKKWWGLKFKHKTVMAHLFYHVCLQHKFIYKYSDIRNNTMLLESVLTISEVR